MKNDRMAVKDAASLGWKSVVFGGGVFDTSGEHPNKKGWDIFELGQKSFWAVPTAVDWDVEVNEDPAYRDAIAAMLTFLCPGEKAAVTGASHLSNLVKSEEAKFYFVEQAFEEAKHYDALRRLIPRISKKPMEAPDFWIRLLYSFGVVDRDDGAFMMGNINIIGEHIAHQIFHSINRVTKDETVKKILALIGKDESRHIAAGQRFFDEVRADYERRRPKIMAKNLATLFILTAASYHVLRPMETLEIRLADVMEKMYNHYSDVVGKQGGMVEGAIVEFLMKNVHVATPKVIENIVQFTDDQGNIEMDRFVATCERILTNPRELRAFFA